MRVLIVEDEKRIADTVRRALEREGFDVAVAEDGATAVSLSSSWKPDVVLLDRVLPDTDGTRVAEQIRSTDDTPIIMVTSLGREDDKVAGLDSGADDYLVKPFGSQELLARIRAVTRRAHHRPSPADKPRHRRLVLDDRGRQVTVDGRIVELSRREFEILRMLLEHADEVVARASITHALWRLPAVRAGKSLDVHVSALRRKLGDAAPDARFIETVRGVGFRLVTDP